MLGLGFGCCCKGQCAKLRNCDTLETITTNSDLSGYAVGDVLARHADEGGGCWELLSLTAKCGAEPETFTVDGEPYSGEGACETCLANACICCGESCAAKAGGLWGFFLANEETSLGTQCLESEPLAFTGTGWAGSNTTDCGIAIELSVYCKDGGWLLDVVIGTIVNLTEVPVPGPGSWAIFWSDSLADYRGAFSCCTGDVDMPVPADSVGISVDIPECPA